MGFDLYVDTVYPAYHIYREEYLNRVNEFKKDGFKFDMCRSNVKNDRSIALRIKNKLKKILSYLKQKAILFLNSRRQKKRITNNNKIVLSMVVKNENGRFLNEVLDSALGIVDEAVIIDDCSSDNTIEICEEKLKNIPHRIIKNKKSLFSKEHFLRKKQWKETLKTNPGWILNLDADEILESNAGEKIKNLIKYDPVDVYNFRLFDMWNELQYRSDELWNAHERYSTFLVRYQPKFRYKFRRTNQHCGRFPKNLHHLTNADVDVRIKHMGWARKEDRQRKYERYMSLDGKGKYGSIDQYKSILDENVNLIDFEQK